LFLVLPLLLRSGWGFWPAFGISVALTISLYGTMFALAPRLGVRL
jgi:hypothetical protein